MSHRVGLFREIVFATVVVVAAMILWTFHGDTSPKSSSLESVAPLAPVNHFSDNQDFTHSQDETDLISLPITRQTARPAPPELRASPVALADVAVRIKNPHVTESIEPLPPVDDPRAAFAAASVWKATGRRESSATMNGGSKPDATSIGSALPSSNEFKDLTPFQGTAASSAIGIATEFLPNQSSASESGNQRFISSVSAASYEPPFAQSSGPSKAPQGTTSYRLADQPKLGDHYKSETPIVDRNAHQIETLLGDFSPDPIIADYPYDPYLNQDIYQCKTLNANQRPLLELGRPWYQLGQLSPGSSILGFHNNVNPQFLIFGDYRQAYASNRVNGDSFSRLAFELNTVWNLFITSTERVVWGVAPFDNGVENTHYDLDNDNFDVETDFDIDFGYFEGDLGALVGGFTGKTLPFDAPFAVGLTPILIQNGIWLNDAVEGLFFTIPARSSAGLGISNMDISFGFVWDEINSDAFAGDKNAAKAYLIYTFIEALNGYFEIDYAFLEDRNLIDRSYHNISMAYSRRFGNFVSHSTRVIANAGQEVSSGNQTADGVLLLMENSLITSNPYTVIPYFNLFAGFDTPQSVAGNQQLIATGILFESDGMTDYPTLDTRGNDAFGGAMGLNLLAQDFSQQLIMEIAAVFRGDDSDLNGDQYGLGLRHQIPLNNSWILRTDAMYGFLRGTEDSTGARIELRKKF